MAEHVRRRSRRVRPPRRAPRHHRATPRRRGRSLCRWTSRALARRRAFGAARRRGHHGRRHGSPGFVGSPDSVRASVGRARAGGDSLVVDLADRPPADGCPDHAGPWRRRRHRVGVGVTELRRRRSDSGRRRARGRGRAGVTSPGPRPRFCHVGGGCGGCLGRGPTVGPTTGQRMLIGPSSCRLACRYNGATSPRSRRRP